ncbi:MAG: hypothetical protein MdMp014T_0796 [Treponematales bacterium]
MRIKTTRETLFLRQRDAYIYVYADEAERIPFAWSVRISIPLYEEIYEFCRTTRRSYRTIYEVFGDRLREEARNGGTPFTLPPGIDFVTHKGGNSFSKQMGTIAGNLGLFCLFTDKGTQAQVNIVHTECERCRSPAANCGKLQRCWTQNPQTQKWENYFGCGADVMWANPGVDIRAERLLTKRNEA